VDYIVISCCPDDREAPSFKTNL